MLRLLWTLFLLSPFVTSEKWISVKMENNKPVYVEKEDRTYPVSARYKDEYNSTGWDKLEIFTNIDEFSPDTAKLMGFAEGLLTKDRFIPFNKNIRTEWNLESQSQEIRDKITEFNRNNFIWSHDNLVNDATDQFAQAASLLVSQFNGLYDGLIEAGISGEEVSREDLWALSSAGDMIDVFSRYIPGFITNDDSEGPAGTFSHGMCSAMIKLSPRNNELMVAHNTWYTYGAMIRLHKTYHYITPAGKKVKMAFSSYPSFIHSLDDFYAIDTGLAVFETSLGAQSPEALKDMNPEGAPSWIRTMTSNLLADNAEQWSTLIGTYGTGTYNGQYFAIDYNLFESGKEPPAKTVMMTEVFPGGVEIVDMTATLTKDSYIASYNVPKTNITDKVLMFDVQREKDPKSIFYIGRDDNCRAQLFKKLQRKVVDFEGMKYVIRYNNYEADSESKNSDEVRDPACTISSRFELRKSPLKPSGFGAYDAKITNAHMMKKTMFASVSGPTVSHQITKFTTADASKKASFGTEFLLPEYTFDWVGSDWDMKESFSPVSPFILITTIVVGSVIVVSFIVFLVLMLICSKRNDKRNRYQPINN